MPYLNIHRYFIYVIVLASFCSFKAHAQGGWKWAVNSSNVDIFDVWLSDVDRSDNIVIAGLNEGGATTTLGSITVSNTGTEQIIVAKADSSGNFLWALGTQNSNAWPANIVSDDSGNIYLLGHYYGTNCSIGAFSLANPLGHGMIFIAKFSSSGAVIWAKNLAPCSYTGVSDLDVDENGNIYVAGAFYTASLVIGSFTLTNSNPTDTRHDVFLTKITSAGIPLWALSYGNIDDDYASKLTISRNGSIFLVGSYNSGPLTIGSDTLNYSHRYLAKFDLNGNYNWAKDQSVIIRDLIADSLDNVYATGEIESSIILGPDTLTNAGEEDVLVAKYDSSGNAIWARSAGGSKIDKGYSISLDPCGKIWISGSMTNLPFGYSGYTMSFNGNLLYEPAGSYDPMFIAEYDNSGTYLYSMALMSGGDDESSIKTNGKGDFYIVGDYTQDSIRFGSFTLPYLATPGENLFIAKYRFDSFECNQYHFPSTILQTVVVDPGIRIYPNPAADQLTIQSLDQRICKIEVINILGQTVYTSQCNDDKTKIDVTKLPSGVYFLKINSSEVRKFIKQ